MADDPALHPPGTAEYRAATSPHNAITAQNPAFVARPADTAAVAALVRDAAARGLTVVPQATGHGAGAPIGDDVLLVDTSALSSIVIDADAQVATVGAGSTWADVNAAAFEYGLLGRAGSAPSVSMCGYAFGGGIGWLVRPHGLQSAALRRVDYIDGAGRRRAASDDAPDELDRDAMIAFRGGGGVGIATGLEFDLVPVVDLHAGLLLWAGEHLDAVVSAWAATIDGAGDTVTTSIALLDLPPIPDFPEEIRGTRVVHLAIAATDGGTGAESVLAAMRGAAAPVVDTWGPADPERLGGIHLDPPAGVPAIGLARWLTADTPSVAVDILRAAVDTPAAMVEIRSVGSAGSTRPGALVVPPGPYLVHVVGAPAPDVSRDAVEKALDAVVRASAPADAGLSAGSWVEGAASVPDALPADLRARVGAIADAVDPDGVIARTRYVI